MTSKKDGCPLAHNHQSSSPKNKVSSAFEVPNKRDRGNDHANGDVNEGGHNNKASFKKGPWTAEEDALLIGYVQKHGERHWNCVQKTGLMRCGKSCRLRWTNHLRPDLKKGAFSPEEERIVLDLHAKLGNKWSKIAAELPGRTDNEVKNFWNTKIKRRMKANQLMVNSQGHRLKEGIAFHQHLHQQKTLKAQGQQDLSSIPNAINSMHSSLASFHTTTNSIPTSASILRAQYLGKLGDNFIRSTQLKDPILSFLNNPAYKCQFPSEEEKSNCDTGKSFYLSVSSHVPRFELPQNSSMADTFLPIHSHARSSSLDTASTNTVFTRNPMGLVESTINATQCGSPLSKAYADLDLNNLLPTNRKVVSKGMAESMYAKIEEPCSLINYEQIPAYGMVGIDGGINDSWISSLLERNSDIEKSSITEEEKCVLDGNIASEELREMAAVTVGKKRLRDDRSSTTCIDGVKKLKVEPSEDLVAMDDDLCSLLHDFSSIGSPTPLYYVDNEVSMPNSKEAFEFPHAATIPSESLAATIATPTTSTSEFNCNKDNNYCTNPNENTLNC